MASIPPLRSDPDFRPSATERSLPPVVDPAAYRRMLFNPFLGILGVAAWVAALRQVLLAMVQQQMPELMLLAGLLGAGLLLPRLFRYHCLDCGRGGRLTRWRQHVCPAVARRILEGTPLRFRMPGPIAQLLLWGYVLAAVLALASAWGVSLR